MAGLFSFRRLKYLKTIFIFFILLATSISSFSQSRFDSLVNKINPDKWSRIVEKKVSRLEDKIIAKTEKTLRRLERTEKKIYRKQLNTKDSLIAKARLAELENKYQQLKGKIKNPSSLLPNAARQYLPHLDTLKTAFQFLNQSNISGNVKDALLKIESFEGKLQQAEEIRKLIRERREQLKQELENLGLVKELKKYNKEVYY